MKANGRGSKTGLKVERRFTAEEEDAYSGVAWSKRTSRITNPDGSVVFEMADAEVPADGHRSPPTYGLQVLPQGRRASARCGREYPSSTSRASRCPVRSDRRGRSSTGWPVAGGGGARSTAISLPRADAQAFYDELAYMLVTPDGRAELAAMVQHRARLRLRHHRPRPGPLLSSIPGTAR